jgi:anaerobic C4-dicarboxylate transporter
MLYLFANGKANGLSVGFAGGLGLILELAALAV